MVIRQAHPGGREPHYRTLGEKLADARAYRDEERIPWTVLVDDLEGSVHQAWGGLSDPAWLVDRDGRISFFCTWTAPKALHGALEDLLARGGRGVVRRAVLRQPEVGPMVSDGWRAIRRGLPGSAVDLMVAVPLSPVGLWLGDKLRPVLAPVTLRDRPLVRARAPLLLGLAVGALALGLFATRRWTVRA